MEPELTATVGTVFTVTVEMAVFEQPNALVPVTVQDVLLVGLTKLVPDEQVYVDAPLGIIVNELPKQIEPLFTETFGGLLTETELTMLPIQPEVFEPVIV